MLKKWRHPPNWYIVPSHHLAKVLFLCHTNSLLNFVLEISKRISFAGLFFTLSWHMDRPQVGQFGNISFTNLDSNYFQMERWLYLFSGIISGFTNVKELYQKIAECYDMPATDVSLDS